MKLRTLLSIKNVKNKRVLLRVDFNVPMKNGRVMDDIRIRTSLPTIRYLLKKGARVIIMSHLGRPNGKRISSLKLNPVAARLEKLLKKKVKKLNDCVGKTVETAVAKMKAGETIMLENVRFHKEEEMCEPKFTKALAALGDFFINDAFSASHRRHASTAGLADHIPAYAGFLVEQEVKDLTPLLKHPARPFTVIIGGAKIDTKIGLIKSFFGKADAILIGGALANTFFAAEGYDIGHSFYEKNKVAVAQEILAEAQKRKVKMVLPVDVVVADEIKENAETADIPLEDVEGNMKILDIGKRTHALFASYLKKSKTVVWNGPVGLCEMTPFRSGTKFLAKFLASLKGKTKVYVGGGDSIDALNRLKIPLSKFTHASTAGGAMLEFLEGKKLPGIGVLIKK